ncbi:MAG: hypothetical protein GXN92_02870 [Candidatus Micrarchaeota archaeon]|nr:hypothetical protein [Candidatus Micrarchaeota archaeon]
MEKRITVITHVDPISQKRMEAFLKYSLQNHKAEVDVEVVSLGENTRPLIEGIPKVIKQVYLRYPIQEMLNPDWIEESVKRGEQNLAIVLLNGEVVGSGSLILNGDIYELGRTAIEERTQGLGLGKALVIVRTAMALFLYKLKGTPAWLYSEPRAINVRTVHNVLKYGGLAVTGITPLYNVNEKKESVLQMYRGLGGIGVLPVVKDEPLNEALREYVKAFRYLEFKKGWPMERKGEILLIDGMVIKEGVGPIGKWVTHDGASFIKVTVQKPRESDLEKIIELASQIADREGLGAIAIVAFATRGFEEIVRFMEDRGFVVSGYVPSHKKMPAVMATQLTEASPKLTEVYFPGDLPDELEKVLKEKHWAHKR